MKKSLIALAVLAASSAAMAQSSVTLFGRLDAGIGQTKTETTGANAKASQSQTVVSSSTFKTTYWGLKGTEDLGNGLKANFNLQSQFSMDTGAAAATLFERFATVGLSGGFGSVNLGRQYTTQYDLFGATDNIGNANVSQGSAVWGAGVKALSTRASNSIKFDSANYGGVSGSLIYALGENKEVAPNVGNSTDLIGVSIKYAAGPLMVGYGHQEEKQTTTSLTTQVTRKFDLLGGTYDLGVAKLNAAYQQSKDGTLKDKEYSVGVTVPFGAAAVYAGYSASKSTGGAAELNSDGYTVAGTYNLSKRTSLYAAYYTSDIEQNTKAVTANPSAIPPVVGVNGGVDTTESSGFGVGVVHLF